MLKLAVIAGTNREGSRTLRLARHVLYRFEAAGSVGTLVDLRELPPDALLSTAYDQRPPELEPMVDAIMEADGLVVVTPEYNGGFPGVLKLFIDLLPHPESVRDRPVCLIGISKGRWGAMRPVEHLAQLWHYRNGFVFPERLFVHDALEGLADDGAPTDARQLRHLDALVPNYLAFLRRLRGYPDPEEG
ncbi:MAG: NAD(P)H-dependent oxidoreductase [Alphaproteobacteria bacterium]|nr:NAD(P)H-dependent oxidoreductase [Alphaproteobacteria bacterium]